jgi:hypothetical protein
MEEVPTSSLRIATAAAEMRKREAKKVNETFFRESVGAERRYIA